MILGALSIDLLGVPVYLGDLLIWGGVATILLSVTMAMSRWLRFSRMSLPFMLGTIFTADRRRADIYGLLLHILNGWWLAALYAMAFQSLQTATWWLGMLLGLVHALFVLAILTPILPSVHPRMASERSGPTARRRLEPPGYFALNYGVRTPLVTIVSHMFYGAVLGAAFQVIVAVG